ncbi:MAG: hypothetical protein KBT27_04225 [Prevotellaceae bacterium]|nr:hypothetical protein [Candidatus Faecinaster equi]
MEKEEKKIGIADVRNAMKVVADYMAFDQKRHHPDAFAVCKEFVKVMGDNARFVENFKEYNYVDEFIKWARENDWFPIIENDNGVRKYIRWKNISAFSFYYRNNKSYFYFECDGKEFELPKKRQDAVCLIELLGIGDYFDLYSKDAYKSNFKPGEEHWKAK